MENVENILDFLKFMEKMKKTFIHPAIFCAKFDLTPHAADRPAILLQVIGKLL